MSKTSSDSSETERFEILDWSDSGRTKTVEPTFDEDTLISWLEAHLEGYGTEFAMNLIESFKGTGEMEWAVERAERRMLEICAQRLGENSERAAEWFRDYHGLNDDQDNGSE